MSVHPRTKDRVVAHMFLCMLAYYVEYHLRRKLALLLFTEETPEEKKNLDPVPMEFVTPEAKKKAPPKCNEEKLPVTSFQSLMGELQSLCQFVIVPKNGSDEVIMIDKITPTQKQAFKLLKIKL